MGLGRRTSSGAGRPVVARGPHSEAKAVSFDDVHARSPETWTVRDPQVHRRRVRAMFARITGKYDAMNHALSLNRDRAWRRLLVERLDADAWEVLDLCAGTCDLALACAAAGKGHELYVADLSPEMLRIGTAKRGASALLPAVADALQLPYRDGSFDAVLVGFGVRNLADVRRGVAEAARVLRPGGQLLILEFFRTDPQALGEERGMTASLRTLLGLLLPLMGRLLVRDDSAYAYLVGSMDAFLTPGELLAVLADAGFTDAVVSRQTAGIAHLVEARKPL
jgi:demethylmenaquinone methyltransferase/2-methoxy-6-polyprenyl-1,4-benzoquinol methylase